MSSQFQSEVPSGAAVTAGSGMFFVVLQVLTLAPWIDGHVIQIVLVPCMKLSRTTISAASSISDRCRNRTLNSTGD